MLKRILSLLMVALTFTFAIPVFAQTFTANGKASQIKSYNGYLFVYWKETGLAPNTMTQYEIDGTVTTNYSCGSYSETGTLEQFALLSNFKGIINQAVTVAPATSQCGGSLASSKFSGLEICDVNNNVCAPITGTY